MIASLFEMQLQVNRFDMTWHTRIWRLNHSAVTVVVQILLEMAWHIRIWRLNHSEVTVVVGAILMSSSPSRSRCARFDLT